MFIFSPKDGGLSIYPAKYKKQIFKCRRVAFISNYLLSFSVFTQEIQVKNKWEYKEMKYNFPRYKVSCPIKESLQWIDSSERWMSAVIRSVAFFMPADLRPRGHLQANSMQIT